MSCKLYTSPNPALVGFLKGVLDDQGIRCYLKNEYIGGGVGDIPPQECWPEIWGVDEAQVMHARRIIDAVMAARAVTGTPWQCARCGEWLEPQFETCWRCAPAE